MPRTSLEKLRQIAQFQQPKCTLRPSNRPLPLKKLWIKNMCSGLPRRPANPVSSMTEMTAYLVMTKVRNFSHCHCVM